MIGQQWMVTLNGAPMTQQRRGIMVMRVDRNGKIVALIYPDIPDDLDSESRNGIPEMIRTTANKSLPIYSKLQKVELMDVPFEKTPKMSIKRFLYK